MSLNWFTSELIGFTEFPLSQGFQFIMHPELMFVQDVKVMYNNTMSDENSMVALKIQVLKNLQTYLQDEDSRMQEADRGCEFKKSISIVVLLRCINLSLYVQPCNHVEQLKTDQAGVFLIQGRTNPSGKI